MRGQRRPTAWFIVAGLVVAVLLAGLVSHFASRAPDGLDSATLAGCTVDAKGTITGGSCIAQRARDHEVSDGPLANYGILGVDNPVVSTGLAGALGVLLTFAVGGGLIWLVRRRTPPRRDEREPPAQTGIS